MKYTNKRFPPSHRPTTTAKVLPKPLSLAEAKAALAAVKQGQEIMAPATAKLTTAPDDPAVVKAARVFRNAHSAMQICKRRVCSRWNEDDQKRQGRLREALKPTRPLIGYEDPWFSVHVATTFTKWLEQEENVSMRIAASNLTELHALVAGKPAEDRIRVITAGWDLACTYPGACTTPGNWTGDMEFLGMAENLLDIGDIGPLKLAVPAKLLEEATTDDSFLTAIVGHLNRQLCTMSSFKKQRSDKKVAPAGAPSTAKQIAGVSGLNTAKRAGTPGPSTAKQNAGASGGSTVKSPAKAAATATPIVAVEKMRMETDEELSDLGK